MSEGRVVHYTVLSKPGQSACQEPSGDGHTNVSEVTCPDCLNALVNAYHHKDVPDPELTPLMRMYKEAGAEIKNGGAVIPPTGLQPFEVVMRVVPVGMEFADSEANPVIKLALLNTDQYTLVGDRMYFIDNDGEIDIPVNQIRYYKENK